MKVEQFKSGTYKQQYQYKSFSPNTINISWTWDDPKVNTLLEKASRALSELDAYSLIVPDVDIFIQMHITKEANTSSAIEGTQTQIGEAVMDLEQIDPEKRDDWVEVQNYVSAMNTAVDELNNIPLSLRLIKDTHATLMQGVRGEKKTPGYFRVSQNWIGGTSLTDAVFIPPHQSEILDLMSDLELFWHNEEIEVPHLIRIAISHYQFETIHPFLDGNGRIGRLLIPLYLISKKLLKKPSLYLSEYLERNRGAYYDALTTVRSSNDLLHWIKFFLLAVIETSENGKLTFEKILQLRNKVDHQILSLGRKAENAKMLLNFLYKRPSVTVASAAKALSITNKAANQLLLDFVDLEILVEITGNKRNRLFLFDEYLRLFL
ncbi:MAG TPA: Fic family protein [Methylotenera sp.]|nr:Fic family protein [Methylotenera sp.]